MQFEGPLDEGEVRSLLRAWAAIDNLSLITLRAPERSEFRLTKEVELHREPWPHALAPPADRPTAQLVGRVHVGCLGVDEVERQLQSVLDPNDTRFNEVVTRPKNSVKKKTCRAFFDIDGNGMPLQDSFGFSPLPDLIATIADFRCQGYDVNQAANLAIAQLEAFEDNLRRAFVKAVLLAEDKEDPVVATSNAIAVLTEGVEDWPLVSEQNVRLENWVHTRWVENPDDAVFDFPLTFFAEELHRIADGEFGSGPLEKYLFHPEQERRDIKNDTDLIRLLNPANLSRAAWPNEYEPRLSQQLGVHLAMGELDDDQLMSVNGPPGTGKTTSLKDFYANVVYKRACAMVEFEKPARAFLSSEVPVVTKHNRYLFYPDPSITGFEILLTSSGNRAVEQVTAEIPGVQEIAQKYRDLFSYFESQANWNPENPIDDIRDGQVEDQAVKAFGGEKWGFACGVAGNSANTNALISQLGMYEGKHSTGGLIRHIKASKRSGDVEWRDVQANFRESQARVERLVRLRVQAWRKYLALDPVKAEFVKAEDVFWKKRDAHRAAREVVREQHLKRYRRKAAVARIEKDLLRHQAREPEHHWFFSKLSERFTWHIKRRALLGDLKEANRRLDAATSLLEREAVDEKWCFERARRAKKRLKVVEKRLEELRSEVRAFGDWVVDDQWFERPHADRQLGNAWIDEELHDAQVSLFAASLEVHQAFVRAAADPIEQNLRTFANLMKGEIASEAERSTVAVAAWQTLFLVVPMISTTFASVARLLQYVPRNTFGYLVVDEGGQALPYAAVGAMARSKRALVVGDPFQTKPIVTLPDILVEALMKSHNVRMSRSPLVCSVQTLSDEVARWGAMRSDKWVGCPLYVHQRCDKPMFEMSNRLIYQDMVYGRTSSQSERVGGMSESGWLDVKHDADGHWNEGDWAALENQVLQGLRGVSFHDLPSIAFISPFNDVVNVLRERTDEFARRLRDAPPERSDRELKVLAGSVHKFQGQERDVVCFVLGGTKDRPGAIRWATDEPNLVNVAVTRARDRLYVVGDLETWGDAGSMAVVRSVFGV